MNAVLLPLLLAAAVAPGEPAQSVQSVESTRWVDAVEAVEPVEAVEAVEPDPMEFACGGAPLLLVDQATFVAADAVAAVEPAAEPVLAAEPATDDTNVVIAAETDADEDRRCLTETGSRIRDEDGRRCDAQAGDAYDRDDIDRTGAGTTAEALRKLSPSVTIRH